MASCVILFQDKLASVRGGCTSMETSCSQTRLALFVQRCIAIHQKRQYGVAIDINSRS